MELLRVGREICCVHLGAPLPSRGDARRTGWDCPYGTQVGHKDENRLTWAGKHQYAAPHLTCGNVHFWVSERQLRLNGPNPLLVSLGSGGARGSSNPSDLRWSGWSRSLPASGTTALRLDVKIQGPDRGRDDADVSAPAVSPGRTLSYVPVVAGIHGAVSRVPGRWGRVCCAGRGRVTSTAGLHGGRAAALALSVLDSARGSAACVFVSDLELSGGSTAESASLRWPWRQGNGPEWAFDPLVWCPFRGPLGDADGQRQAVHRPLLPTAATRTGDWDHLRSRGVPSRMIWSAGMAVTCGDQMD